jgi:hypothetical protein
MSDADDRADFEADLEDALEWEELAVDRVEELLLSARATNVSYDDRPELQRAGIDGIVRQQQPSFDIKVQDYRHTDTGNLPIEVWSSFEDNEPGWFYTAESDMIVWVYKNRVGTDFYHTGYLMPLRDGLIEWFNDRIDKFRDFSIDNVGTRGDEYTTTGRLVPIDTFPSEYLAEFDPRLPTNRETPQSNFGDFTGD